MDVQPLSGMLRHFQALPDPRRFNVTYPLAQRLTCTLMAVLCRCDDYEEVAGWVAARHAGLVEVLGLPEDRCPCRKTFERLYRRLHPAQGQTHQPKNPPLPVWPQRPLPPPNPHRRGGGVNVFTLTSPPEHLSPTESAGILLTQEQTHPQTHGGVP